MIDSLNVYTTLLEYLRLLCRSFAPPTASPFTFDYWEIPKSANFQGGKGIADGGNGPYTERPARKKKHIDMTVKL